MQVYSNPAEASDPHKLPDTEVFQLTSDEAAEMADDDTVAEARRNLGNGPFMCSRDRSRLIDEIIRLQGDQGGWYWRPCFPGCLPDGEPYGPFASADEAIADAQGTR